jgi:hypothetical protein
MTATQTAAGAGEGEALAPAAPNVPPLSPEDYAAEFVLDLTVDDAMSDRSRQADRRELGVSDIGTCREYVRLFLDGVPFTDQPKTTAARLGSYIHEGVLAARRNAQPHLLIEQTVTVELPNGMRVLGHADEIDPARAEVTDAKTVDGLGVVRRVGATGQQRFQRHLYGWGAWQAGLFGDIHPSQVTVRNVWLDRSGGQEDVHVEQEALSKNVLDEAVEWLYEVEEARSEGRQASKDQQAEWCRSFCPFFTACRGEEDTSTTIFEPRMVQAAELYAQGHALAKDGEQLKKAALATLGEVQGSTGRYVVKRTFVEGGGSRRPYWRTTVREVA